MNIPIIHIPSAEYHAESRNGRYLSSHLLADFRQSPQLYHREVSGEIAQTESPALALGRAAHCLILEGRASFDEQHLVASGPVNPKTGEPYGKASKAYAEWLSAQTREIVSQKDFGFILKLQKSVWTHPTASALLDNGASEATVRASTNVSRAEHQRRRKSRTSSMRPSCLSMSSQAETQKTIQAPTNVPRHWYSGC